jgi:lipocalin
VGVGKRPSGDTFGYSRARHIDDPLRQSLVVKLATLGYKTDALIWVQQP